MLRTCKKKGRIFCQNHFPLLQCFYAKTKAFQKRLWKTPINQREQLRGCKAAHGFGCHVLVGGMASLGFSVTQRRGESEPWAQDLASPLASTTRWCVLGGTAPQQPHRLIHPTVRRAFGRTRDMLTGKAKVPMEKHLEGRDSLSINSAGWQRQQEYQADMILVPEANFLLKCNLSTARTSPLMEIQPHRSCTGFSPKSQMICGWTWSQKSHHTSLTMFQTESSPTKGLGLESISELDNLIIPRFHFSLHFSNPLKKHLLSSNGKDIHLEKFE